MSAYPRYLRAPFRIGADGRAVTTSDFQSHVRDEVIQLVLTNGGERAFLPEFGASVRRLVLDNVDTATRGVTKAALVREFTRWLSERVTIEELVVTSDVSTLAIDISYRALGAEQSTKMRFQRGEV
jgi:Bacteriophage baseplate protein W